MSNTLVTSIEEIDYDYKPETKGGLYLRLAKKGDKVRVRLVGKPIAFKKTFTNNDTGESEVKQNFAWCVIDRTDKDHAVRCFQAGTMVFLAIKDLASSPEWGDPAKYDLIIERTEETGRYYTVKPSPNGMGDLSHEDQVLLAEKNIRHDDVRSWLVPVVEGKQADAPTGGGGQSDYDPFAE